MDKNKTKILCKIFESELDLYKNEFEFGKDYLIADAIIKVRDQKYELEKEFSKIQIQISPNTRIEAIGYTQLPDIPINLIKLCDINKKNENDLISV